MLCKQNVLYYTERSVLYAETKCSSLRELISYPYFARDKI